MKPTLADGQNELADKPWPSVLQIASSDEFQQSFSVAQLAMKLCELKRAELSTGLQKESIVPEKFLAEAWQLVLSARELVLRPQTPLQYFVDQGGSQEAFARALERMLP